MGGHILVTFEPAGVTAHVDPGTTLADAAASAGVLLASPCGGRGVCGRCAVRVLEGRPMPPGDAEARGLARAPSGVRLACLATVGSESLRVGVLSPGLAEENMSSFPAGGDGQTTHDQVVAAVDLGTTTVSALVVDPASTRRLGEATVVNQQIRFGADVVSRIGAARAGRADELSQAAKDSLVAALSGACSASEIECSELKRIVVAGNTAMISLLSGLDVSGLTSAPFEMDPLLLNSDVLRGSLEHVAPDTTVLAVPAVDAFVGGDLVAGLFAAGLHRALPRRVLYVDIGTNAEIALCGRDEILVASTAAGPAFEGSGITHGSAAGAGAVIRARMEGSALSVDVIGGGAPASICGSGLVSLVALLRRTGHLDASGRMWPQGPLSSRFMTVDNQVVLEVGDSGPPYLSQADVRLLQTAKAAVAAGLLAVIARAGEPPEEMLVAGAFGGSLDVTELVDLGIVPSDIRRIDAIGPTALTGAAAIAADTGLMLEAVGLSRESRHIELASDPVFRREFVASMRFARFRLRGH
ncbi:MAG: ASKHA domain-containing protein [Coriobacteriia bacterium]|nr:ASKHA domain-containing protein [Coriobacteriia bacterium]